MLLNVVILYNGLKIFKININVLRCIVTHLTYKLLLGIFRQKRLLNVVILNNQDLPKQFFYKKL